MTHKDRKIEDMTVRESNKVGGSLNHSRGNPIGTGGSFARKEGDKKDNVVFSTEELVWATGK